MKFKIIFALMAIFLPLAALYSAGDKENEKGVVITPHKTVSVLPADATPQPQVLPPQQLVSLRGSVAYGNDVQNGNVYHFNLDDPSVVSIDGSVSFVALCGDFSPDDPDHIWIIDFNDQFLKQISITSLAADYSIPCPCPLVDGIWSALPINKVTGQFYGIATSGSISALYEIDRFTGETILLAELDIVAVISASFDMAGILYMFDIDSDQVFTMDVNSLTYQPLGPAGFDGNYAQGMGLDPLTNDIYLAAYVDFVGPELRLLDKGTGNTTLVSTLPGETGAFGFVEGFENDFIVSGIDEWCATGARVVFGNNGDLPKIPDDFFFPGSEPFEGAVQFHGLASEGGQLPFSDVTIMRLDDVYFSQPYPSTGQVNLQIVSLSLKSKEPVFIPPESFFDVFCEIQLDNEQFGMNAITKESQFGGTFNKELMFYPQITFVQVDNPSNQIVYNPGFPIMFYSPDSYNWTMSPIPNDFDPIGEDPYVLVTEGGSSLELWPFMSREDFSFLAMDEGGVPLEWFGTGYENGTWYEYPNYGWWNVWLYDHPFDNSRSKYVRMELDVMPMNPDFPMDVTVVYNWSTGNWTGWPEVDRPPLPLDVIDPIIEDQLIVRSDPIYEYQGVFAQRELIVNEFVIDGYNPEWLSIDVMGSNFVMNANVHHVCFKPYTSSGSNVNDLKLRIGDYLISEPWHDWIGGMDRDTEIQLLVDDPDGEIMQVDFLFSMDMGQTWQQFYTDTDGSEPALSTYEPSGDGDGWTAAFYHELLPFEDFMLMFRAEALLENGEVLSVEKEIEFDPTPPDGTEINLEDWMIIEDDYILLDIAPGECIDLDKVWVIVEPKVDSFFKGIPPISQQPHSPTHCSPTAAAACLKYFESQGDNTIGGGLTDHQLVDALANLMKTNQGKNGTYISDIASGLSNWISNHGDNYTVRKTDYDWETMRDELERCQDVISSIFWPGGGGHSMTFNSIVNEPNADGTITVDWMDPWTGQIEYGQITPGSGHVGNMGGAGGGGSGEMGTMIIVCPKEEDAGPGSGGQIIPGPFPQPGIIIPIPNPGLWWIRIIYYDQSLHVARTDLVLKRLDGEKDWGDAPDGPYPTLGANNGAFHTLDGFTFMGSSVDPEPNGLPNAHALGDDLNNTDDEDGVTLLNSLVVGKQATIRVIANNGCMLNAWFDFDQNGSWADAGEHVFANVPLTAGANILSLTVPAGIAPGQVYSRFRVNQNGGISYHGDGYEGEVEDYKFIVFKPIPDTKSGNPQFPDPTGWDVNFTAPAILGDDWICNESGPVEDFHFWISWFNDMIPDDLGGAIQQFDVMIYSDIPANQSQTDYSMPGELLWSRSFLSDEFTWEPAFEHLQGWDDPYDGFADPWNHYKCFRIDIDNFDDPFIQQEGTIYWLVISANVTGGGGGSNSITVTLDNVDSGTLPYQPWMENDVILQIQDLSGPAVYLIEPDGINLWSALLHCDISGLSGLVMSAEVDVIPYCGPGCGADVQLFDAGVLIDQVINTQSGNIETITVNNPGGFTPDMLTVGCYEGKVLEIRFFLEGGDAYEVGWKSSTDHWNDNAVYFMPDTQEQWLELYDPISQYPIDLSFVITGSPGEVYDFGDCPDDPYPTLLANNGARHAVDSMTYLGALIDAEPDGQPNMPATGDDISDFPDEDGITFGPIMPGSPAQITIDPNINPDPDLVGFLQGWMDFNRDGDWDDQGERIFNDEVLHFSNPACLLYLVPADAQPGAVYARFRFSTVPGLNYFGFAPDGEVEDYLVEVVQDEGYKWMQDPCPELPGLHAHDYVIPPDFYDYSTIADDWQCNGGVVTDIHWWGNYEDVGFGINYFHLSIHETEPGTCLPAQQEIWGMDVPLGVANETLWGGQIFSYEYVLDMPFEQIEGKTYWLDITAFSNDPNIPAIWRWQESDRSTVPYNILCPAVSRSLSNTQWVFLDWPIPEPVRYSQMAFAITSKMVEIDFGDAPDDPYPTLLANNGARHLMDGITYLGDLIDAEVDGQPNIPATGDDMAVSDDEDGVVFRGPLVAGSPTILKVKASVDGKLNVWLDVDRNATWAEAYDHVFMDYNLVAGWNTLTLNVPASAKVGISYMRFRFSQEGGETYYGPSTYGEVEDYLVKVYPENWGFIPTPVNHTILVPLNVLLTNTTLSANDAIGVWYADDNGNMVCGGAEIWDGVSDRVVLAFADDNTTLEKDGFDDGEMLTWAIHHTGSGTDEVVSVSYDAALPQSDGKFTSYGLSKLTEIRGLSATATASPALVCAGDPVQLDVIVTGGSGSYTYFWSSNPAGFNSNLKNPIDYPLQDVVYTVVVDDGMTSVSSSVTVSVQPGPTANAGPDVTICETDLHQLNGTATNYASLLWASGGDGVFDITTIEDPVYYPGVNDIVNGFVKLTFSATGIMPCSNTVTSEMVITFTYLPTADAGDDGTVCADGTYQLDGAVTHSNVYYWSTAGDGTFDDFTQLDAMYSPGSSDALNKQVTLTLTANAILPCQVDAASSMTLIVLNTQKVSLFKGWNGLSSYLSPYNKNDNNDLFDPVLDNLVIVYNLAGQFWYTQGVDNLVWDEESGYVIKLDGDDEMIFCGDEVSSQMVNLEQGLNIVPVLSDFDADVISVFDSGVDVKLVLEVAGMNLYWPDYSINTIGNLEVGKSYFAFMNSDDVIDFSNATTKSGGSGNQVAIAETPWNKVLQSPGGHIVAFAEPACKGFAAGDVIGAFTQSGVCAGIAAFGNISTGVVLKGDDPYTWQTDGFTDEEAVSFKLYRPSSGEHFDLQVEYDSDLDHSGRFHNFSTSAITMVKMTPTGIFDPAGADIRIYPNPSHGIFNIDGISGETEITVYDAYGNIIHELITNEKSRINLSAHADGIYLVKIKTFNGTHYQKVVIN